MGNKEQETVSDNKNGNAKISQAIADEMLCMAQQLVLAPSDKKLICKIYKLAFILRELR